MKRVFALVLLGWFGSAWATAGYGLSGKCYASGAEFAAGACVAAGPFVVVQAGTAYVFSCTAASWSGSVASLTLQRVSVVSSGSPVVTAFSSSVYPAPCDVDQNVTDADQVNATLAIFGLGLGLLAVLWSGRKVFELLAHGRREI